MTRSETRRHRAWMLEQQQQQQPSGKSYEKGGKDPKGKSKGKGATAKGKDKGGQKGREQPKGKSKGDKGKGHGQQVPVPPVAPPPAQQQTVNRVKRDQNGAPIPVLNNQGHRVNLCWWYQSQFNGDFRCPRKQPECRFIHAKCKDRNEFVAIPIPRGESPAPTGQRANPKAKPEAKPKAKATAKPKTRSGSPAPKVKP